MEAESITDEPITTFLTRRDGCAKQYVIQEGRAVMDDRRV